MKKMRFVSIVAILTLLMTGCRALVDMGIVKNEEGDYKVIDQGELEEYNRLAKEAHEKGIDDVEQYAKDNGWTY